MTTPSRIYGLSAVAQLAIVGDTTQSITAAGTTQATAAVLTTDNNSVATVAAGSGVILPIGEIAKSVMVYNGGANPLMVYPPINGSINQGSVNTAVTILPGGFVTFEYFGPITLISDSSGVVSGAKFVTTTAASGALNVGDMEGAGIVYLASSLATALTTRTAAQIFAGIANGYASFAYTLRVLNTNAGTLALTGGTGVTITGTAIVATNTFRDYLVTLVSATAVTLQSVGAGTV